MEKLPSLRENQLKIILMKRTCACKIKSLSGIIPEFAAKLIDKIHSVSYHKTTINETEEVYSKIVVARLSPNQEFGGRYPGGM